MAYKYKPTDLHSGHQQAAPCLKPYQQPPVRPSRPRQLLWGPARATGEDSPSLRSPDDGCASLFPYNDALLRELAQLPGVRVEVQQHEEEEDEEEWEEVMAELSDPWMAKPPAGPDLLEDLAGGAPGAMQSVAPPAVAAEVQEVVGPVQLRELLQQQPSLVVLDVRSTEEHDAGPKLPGAMHCPISQLSGEVATQLAGQPVLVLGTGDHKGSQACIRLTRVYGALLVFYYEPGLRAWPADVSLS